MLTDTAYSFYNALEHLNKQRKQAKLKGNNNNCEYNNRQKFHISHLLLQNVFHPAKPLVSLIIHQSLSQSQGIA
jgi:hypothetical protein